MHELTRSQTQSVGGGNLWFILSLASAVIDVAQGFNDAYNAANVQK